MGRREFRTLDEIDRYVSRISYAEALLKNSTLTDSERELIQQWLENPAYGGRVRSHEQEHESLEGQIGLAREIAVIDSSRALWWAKIAFWLAAAALLLSIRAVFW
jgi:hypothetical protein